MSKMKDIVRRRLNIYREKAIVSHGMIGNLATGEINVPDRTGVIYVTSMDGTVSEVVNRRVPNVFQTPVLYGRDPGDMPNTVQVLSSWDIYASVSENNPANGVNYHHEQHEWPNGDTAWVAGEQFRPSLVVSGTGLSVKIYPGNYYTESSWLEQKRILTVDLSAIAPALAANECRMVLIVIDASGTAVARVGGIITGWANLTAADIPLPEIHDNALCAIKMYYGQTALRKDGYNNDFVDLRFTGVASGAGIIGAGTVTNTKLANMAQATIKGRAAGAGAPVDLTALQTAVILGSTGCYRAVATKTADYTLTVNDSLVVLSGSTARTFTLPAATGAGQTYRIANESTAALTVNAAGAETIKGALSQVLYTGEDLIITDYATGAWV
jgi:hypothetical protein